MICDELINRRPRRNGNSREIEGVDLDNYWRLPRETRNLISGWLKLADIKLEGSESSCFEAFIFAWIAFNGWGACISNVDQDSGMILALKRDNVIATNFANLCSSDSRLNSYATHFSLYWPIFEVKSARD